MSISKDTWYVAASSIANLLTSLAIGVLTARLLGPAGKGQLYLVMQLAAIGSLVFTIGLGPSYQYFLTKGTLSRSAIISHFIGTSSVLLLLVAAIYLWGQPLLRWTVGDLSGPLLLVGCVAIFVSAEVLLTSCIVAALPDGIRISSILGVASALAYVTMLLLFLWLLRWHVLAAAIGYLISLLVRVTAMLAIILRDPGGRLTLRWWTPGRALFMYGGSSFVANLMVTSVFRIDVFIVNAFLGAAPLGIYSVAVSFAELALMVPSALGQALFKHLPASGTAERVAILRQSSRIVIAIALVIGAGLIIAAYPLVVLLMGGRFAGAVVPLMLLVPGLVAMSVNYVFANFYAACGRPLVTAAAFGGGALVNVLVNLVLIPRLGISGAALASTVAYPAVAAAFVVFLRREHQLSLGELLVLRREDVALLRSKLPFLREPGPAQHAVVEA